MVGMQYFTPGQARPIKCPHCKEFITATMKTMPDGQIQVNTIPHKVKDRALAMWKYLDTINEEEERQI